jgi:hypothetical protein
MIASAIWLRALFWMQTKSTRFLRDRIIGFSLGRLQRTIARFACE